MTGKVVLFYNFVMMVLFNYIVADGKITCSAAGHQLSERVYCGVFRSVICKSINVLFISKTNQN